MAGIQLQMQKHQWDYIRKQSYSRLHYEVNGSNVSYRVERIGTSFWAIVQLSTDRVG